MTSLRRRLLGVLTASILAAWLATAFFSYIDAKQQIGAMLDARLAETGALLLSLAQGGGSRVALPGGADRIAYRVWRDGATVLASVGTAAPLDAEAPAGLADALEDGRRWRVYTLRDQGGMAVQVAEPHDIRDALAESVASHLLHPLAVAVPVLAAFIWLSVGWGLAPLGALAKEVARRAPDSLAPLPAGNTPGEARPLVEALNALFARVTALLDRERRFTADAAHELRTPLAAIRTHAQVAQAADGPERPAALQGVVRGTERAAHLVDQLLVLARLDPQGALPAGTSVRLDDIAAACIAEYAEAAAGKRIDLGLRAGDGATTVAGNADLLAIMLRNLVDNALRYTPSGGRVDVALRRHPAGTELRVEDDGPGIPAGERARVLERFYRVLGSGEAGSGLGLSIVARIAEMHGAVLSLEDGASGRGLAVSVILPPLRLT